MSYAFAFSGELRSLLVRLQAVQQRLSAQQAEGRVRGAKKVDPHLAVGAASASPLPGVLK